MISYEKLNNNTLTISKQNILKMPFQCRFCLRTFSTRSGCTQHTKYCMPLDYSSSEGSDIITGVNDMSLDSEDLNREVKNWQIAF